MDVNFSIAFLPREGLTPPAGPGDPNPEPDPNLATQSGPLESDKTLAHGTAKTTPAGSKEGLQTNEKPRTPVANFQGASTKADGPSSNGAQNPNLTTPGVSSATANPNGQPGGVEHASGAQEGRRISQEGACVSQGSFRAFQACGCVRGRSAVSPEKSASQSGSASWQLPRSRKLQSLSSASRVVTVLHWTCHPGRLSC